MTKSRKYVLRGPPVTIYGLRGLAKVYGLRIAKRRPHKNHYVAFEERGRTFYVVIPRNKPVKS